jgi:thioredoxin reductase
VGNHGKATELKIPGAELKGKVRYKVQDPNQYRGKHCLVVGAGNSAVEAAVDLAAFRSGSEITGWRDNDVSIVIRGEFKRDVVLENKMMIYECLDAGRMRVFRGIKYITDTTVVVTRDDPEKTEEIKNDHVFAFIGGEKPTHFLTRIGIEIRKAGNAETG